jgi:L-arabinose isomerase
MQTATLDFSRLEIWFVTGSQHLYGPEAINQVAEHAEAIVRGLSESAAVPLRLVPKPVMTTPEAIRRLALEANSEPNCVGIVAWMHTFSPAKMWISSLKRLAKPLLHLHTQFNRDLPWSSIDMDFMNLNQSAHGDREFGFLTGRMRLPHAVVVGFWRDEHVLGELATWACAAAAWHDAQNLKVARFGDNMRSVAVTEGDKVEAELRLGYSVNGYGVGDLAARLRQVTDEETNRLVREYEQAYMLAAPLRAGGSARQSLLEAARIEIALRGFLADGGFKAFTDTFEDLHGLPQLPGIAVQRLMADGYGFGAEGDWKTAALVRSMKVMAMGRPGGTSFMEDYTYDLASGKVLGAHMLEICPSISDGKPSAEIHPLSIGGKADPVRLVFNSQTGRAVVASIVDMGNRFRMIANVVHVVSPDHSLPKLPVARALWQPEPDLRTAAACWIYAGGAHHTGFSLALNEQHLERFAEMAGIEFLLIDRAATVSQFKKELRWNDVYYHLARGI